MTFSAPWATISANLSQLPPPKHNLEKAIWLERARRARSEGMSHPRSLDLSLEPAQAKCTWSHPGWAESSPRAIRPLLLQLLSLEPA